MTQARKVGGKVRDTLFGSVADFRLAFEKAWKGEKMDASEFRGPLKMLVDADDL